MSPFEKGHSTPHFRNLRSYKPRPIAIVAKRSPISATAELLLKRLVAPVRVTECGAERYKHVQTRACQRGYEALRNSPQHSAAASKTPPQTRVPLRSVKGHLGSRFSLCFLPTAVCKTCMFGCVSVSEISRRLGCAG